MLCHSRRVKEGQMDANKLAEQLAVHIQRREAEHKHHIQSATIYRRCDDGEAEQMRRLDRIEAHFNVIGGLVR